MTRGDLARAAVEGLLCVLADALEAVRRQGAAIERVTLVGGGARSAAVRTLAPAVLGVPVVVPAPGEYVADGAARQAAWMLSGEDAAAVLGAGGCHDVRGRPGAGGAGALPARGGPGGARPQVSGPEPSG